MDARKELPTEMRIGRNRLDHETAVRMVRAFHVERISQTEIANRIKCHLSTVSLIVWGRRHPAAYAQVKAELAANAQQKAAG